MRKVFQIVKSKIETEIRYDLGVLVLFSVVTIVFIYSLVNYI